MDYYCKNCAEPVVYVGKQVEDDAWEHEEFNPNCGKPELNRPEKDEAYAERKLNQLLEG